MSKEGTGHWLPRDPGDYKNAFERIEITVLNYCIKSKGSKTSIAFAHRLRKRYEEEVFDSAKNGTSSCSLAPYQCVTDWYHPAKWTYYNTSKVVIKYM